MRSCDRRSASTVCGAASGPFVRLRRTRGAASPIPHIGNRGLVQFLRLRVKAEIRGGIAVDFEMVRKTLLEGKPFERESMAYRGFRRRHVLRRAVRGGHSRPNRPVASITSTTIGAVTGCRLVRTPYGFSTRRTSRRASPMPSCRFITTTAPATQSRTLQAETAKRPAGAKERRISANLRARDLRCRPDLRFLRVNGYH